MIIARYTIPLEPRTKKNSSRIVGGRLLPSAAYVRYAKDALWFLPRPDKPIDYAVNVKAIYYMRTERIVDKTNLESALMDILVDAGILADDNSRIVAGTDGSRVRLDRSNPRTEIVISQMEEDAGHENDATRKTESCRKAGSRPGRSAKERGESHAQRAKANRNDGGTPPLPRRDV